ncbi:hypothetical protein A2U01_0024271, partial [Trifolium medium]|nr:hypothetical protein [Trifolium medium]
NFPRLFSLSNQKDSLVSEVGARHGDRWIWSFSWRRNLFQWEEDLVAQLLDALESVVLNMEDDTWCWVPNPEGIFSVKSTYDYLAKVLSSEDVIQEEMVLVFDQIWDSPAPSKVIAFSWQLLYDRIPTRRNLDYRRILAPEASRECVGCVGKVESSIHLFLHCPTAMLVWYDVFRWIGVVIVIPPTLFSLFEVLRGMASNKKIRMGYLLIWHATLWCLWKARNNTIFANGSMDSKDIVEEIKVLSWKWSLVRLKSSPCMFYEWTWDPGDCFLR